MASNAYPVLQTRNGNWRSDPHYRIKGLNIPTLITSHPAKLEQYLTNFQTRSDDVFVVSYLKSGKLHTSFFLITHFVSGSCISNKKALHFVTWILFKCWPTKGNEITAVPIEFCALEKPRWWKSVMNVTSYNLELVLAIHFCVCLLNNVSISSCLNSMYPIFNVILKCLTNFNDHTSIVQKFHCVEINAGYTHRLVQLQVA